MPKRNRATIFEYLFKEGVLVCMKDTHLAKHPEIDVPNLHVMKSLQVHSCLMSISLHQCNSKYLVLYLVLEIERICHWAVCLASLLLVSYQWGNPVFEGLPPPSSWGTVHLPIYMIIVFIQNYYRLCQPHWSPRELNLHVHDQQLFVQRRRSYQRTVLLTGALELLEGIRRLMLALVPTPIWNS